MSSSKSFLAGLVISSSALAAAQAPSTPGNPPAFEVASVRQNTADDGKRFASPGLIRTPLGRSAPVPGPVTVRNMALRDLIAAAYDIDPTFVSLLITGGSGRVLDARFDIDARPPEGAPPSDLLPMLRTLLADRFKLRARIEMRDVPIYALVLARDGRLGPRLKPSDVDCNAPGARRAIATPPAAPAGANAPPVCRLNVYEFGKPGPGDLTMSDSTALSSLIARIQPFVDRPLVDASGLSGIFEWSVSFATNPNSTTAPVVYTALQEQLGIRLERRTAPYDVVVIDSVEMPTPN